MKVDFTSFYLILLVCDYHKTEVCLTNAFVFSSLSFTIVNN